MMPIIPWAVFIAAANRKRKNNDDDDNDDDDNDDDDLLRYRVSHKNKCIIPYFIIIFHTFWPIRFVRIVWAFFKHLHYEHTRNIKRIRKD